MNESTIAAVASPSGTGAISLLRISGADAAGVAERVFRGRVRGEWEPRMQHFGRIVEAEGTVVDEVLLTWFPAPRSFTGEDVVEIACHGGVLVTRRVLDVLLAAGAEPARPGEFSERAFLNGRLDLTQAEAIMDLISAQTDLAAKAAREQLQGRLGAELERIRQELLALIAHVEAYIDFPDEDIDPDSMESMLERLDGAIASVDGLLATADQGRILREGLRTVICGAPNAGKSSLLNVLMGFDRAIVNETAGTTRDTIEEVINLEGIPVRLVDTAGIRKGGESIEREGIERSRAQVANAELILLVIDASAGAEQLDSLDLPEGARVVRLLNKSDLETHPDWRDTEEGVSVSCLAPDAAATLRDHLYQRIVSGGTFDTANPVAINARHRHCLLTGRESLETARRHLAEGESVEFVSVDLRVGLDALGEVIGKTDVEEILGEIFSTFCIGK